MLSLRSLLRGGKTALEARRSPQLPAVILVSAGVGKGKSRSLQYVLQRARSRSIPSAGIITLRRIHEGSVVGYDGLDCMTGERFPLATLPKERMEPDWRKVKGLGFAFSKKGFLKANAILRALPSDLQGLIFIDEVGRLEMMHEGMYPGLMDVVANLQAVGSLLVLSCRREALNWVEGLLSEHIPRIRWSPGDPEELWQLVRSRL